MYARDREFDPATLDLSTPEHYERHGYPHDEWTWLRSHDPVFWYERPNVEPFWAITKHADIIAVGKQPALFLNAPRLAVFTLDLPPPEASASRHLLNMDPPDHARYRRVTSSWFTPRAIRAMDEKVARVTREVLDAAAAQEAGDFVRDVSAPITIAVIAEMLGVPRADWSLLFRWTNEIIAPQDPEFLHGTAHETLEQARVELFMYFNDLVTQRRARPTDDIVSVVANGEVDGAALPAVELLSYYFLLVVAAMNHTQCDDRRMLALLEHPDEWGWHRQPVDSAVEEIPLDDASHQFARTARDVESAARRSAGQSLCLFYASGNREEVFGAPFAFRVGHESAHRLRHGRARLSRRTRRVWPPPRGPNCRAAAVCALAGSSACARASSAASNALPCAGRSPRGLDAAGGARGPFEDS
jgi:cytochrome P450